MKSINVFKSNIQYDLTIVEKKKLFSDIQIQTNLPQYHFDNFLRHETNKNYYNIKKSNFLNLNLKIILNWVSPIINEIPNKKIKSTSSTSNQLLLINKENTSSLKRLNLKTNYSIVLQTENLIKGYLKHEPFKKK